MITLSYADLSFIRDLTNLPQDEIDDPTLETIRERAEQKLIKDITIEKNQEELKGNLNGTYINGSNNTFYTHHTPIADTNADESIDSNDVTVHVWAERDDEGTRSEISVDSVTADTGRVILGSSPASDDDKITINYSYYNAPDVPDWNLVEMASAFLTGYLGSVKLRGAVPSKYSIGDLSIDEELPGKPFLREYRSTINDIRNLID